MWHRALNYHHLPPKDPSAKEPAVVDSLHIWLPRGSEIAKHIIRKPHLYGSRHLAVINSPYTKPKGPCSQKKHTLALKPPHRDDFKAEVHVVMLSPDFHHTPPVNLGFDP